MIIDIGKILESLIYLPHLVMLILLIISIHSIYFKRAKISFFNSIPFLFLATGILGLYWDLLIGYIDINTITYEINTGITDVEKALNNSSILIVVTILGFYGSKYIINKDRK